MNPFEPTPNRQYTGRFAHLTDEELAARIAQLGRPILLDAAVDENERAQIAAYTDEEVVEYTRRYHRLAWKRINREIALSDRLPWLGEEVNRG